MLLGREDRIRLSQAVFLGRQLSFDTEAWKNQWLEMPEPGDELVLVLVVRLFWVGK